MRAQGEVQAEEECLRRVGVVTESVACVPPEEAHRWGIRVVPVPLIFEGRSLRDDELDLAELFERLREVPPEAWPTTSQPAPEEYEAAFWACPEPEVLCVTLPPKLSGCFRSALRAAERLCQRGKRVEVLDSGSGAMGQGFVALAAARAAARGLSLEGVRAEAEAVARRVRVVGVLETLEHLARGGRLPPALARLGDALHVKPLLTIAQGEVRASGWLRARNPEALRQKLLERFAPEWTCAGRLHVAVMHVLRPQDAQALASEIAARFQPVELFVTPFTAVMAVHTGPGLLGVAYYSDPPADESEP